MEVKFEFIYSFYYLLFGFLFNSCRDFEQKLAHQIKIKIQSFVQMYGRVRLGVSKHHRRSQSIFFIPS